MFYRLGKCKIAPSSQVVGITTWHYECSKIYAAASFLTHLLGQRMRYATPQISQTEA